MNEAIKELNAIKARIPQQTYRTIIGQMRASDLGGATVGINRLKKKLAKEDAVTMLFDFKCLMYSTHKHIQEAPRVRLIIPISREVSAEEYVPVSRMVAKDIGMEMVDIIIFLLIVALVRLFMMTSLFIVTMQQIRHVDSL